MIVVRGTVIQDAFSPVLEDHGVIIEENRIVDIKLWKDIRLHTHAKIIGSEDSIILPGFVNTHSHAVQTFFRGAADDRDLIDWLNEVILPGEATLTSDEAYASSLLGYLEMISNGITTTNDMATVKHAGHTMQAAKDSGIRAHVGKMFMDQNAPAELIETKAKAITEANKLADMYTSDQRIRYAYTPRFILTCSNELMKTAKLEARKRGLLYHTHAAENVRECKAVEEMTGSTYIHALDALDVLDSKTVLAHCVWTTKEEREILKQRGVAISHNPSSNGKLASGIAPLVDYVKRDIPVGLATDGSPATGGHDMFFEMKLANFYQKAINQNPTAIDAKTVFHLATLGGAKALSMENQIGSIHVGKFADLLVLEPKFPSAWPMYDLFSFLAYTANVRDISSVMIDGKMLVENGTLLAETDKLEDFASSYSKHRPWVQRFRNKQ